MVSLGTLEHVVGPGERWQMKMEERRKQGCQWRGAASAFPRTVNVTLQVMIMGAGGMEGP